MTAPHPRDLSIHDFTYPLPAERIAAEPLPDRAGSRLLVSRNGQLADKYFRDLPQELRHAGVARHLQLQLGGNTPGDAGGDRQLCLPGQAHQQHAETGQQGAAHGNAMTPAQGPDPGHQRRVEPAFERGADAVALGGPCAVACDVQYRTCLAHQNSSPYCSRSAWLNEIIAAYCSRVVTICCSSRHRASVC